MKLKINLFAACVLTVSLAGCLKDKPFLDPADTQNVIEFANTANLTSPATSKYPLLSVNIVMDPAGTYNAVVSYSGANDAPQDITVEVGVADPAVITAYNTQNGKAYVALPANLYSLPATKVTIPKGKRQVNFPINFTNADQLYNKGYVLALTIKSASSGIISGNFNTMLYLLNGINRYDGVYTLKFRFGANDRGYDINPATWFFSDVQLVTTGSNTVVLRNLNAGSPYPHAAIANGLPTSIGSGATASLTPQFTFDLANNSISNITNSVAGPKTAVPNPGVTDNRQNPATKDVFASFILKETGKADMIINDTLVYKSPR
jgi:hypothetical protein